MWLGPVSIAPLLRAFKKFEAFSKHSSTEQERAGIIQAFAYGYELCWKSMKRLLEERGRSAYSPREVFRMSALEGFIQDVDPWFTFLKKRNLTVHTYEEKEAEQVLSICPLFAKEVKAFLRNIGVHEATHSPEAP